MSKVEIGRRAAEPRPLRSIPLTAPLGRTRAAAAQCDHPICCARSALAIARKRRVHGKAACRSSPDSHRCSKNWRSPARAQRRSLDANFHDWLLLGSNRILVTVGHVATPQQADPVEAALVAQAVWTSVRAGARSSRRRRWRAVVARGGTLWPMPTPATRASVAVAARGHVRRSGQRRPGWRLSRLAHPRGNLRAAAHPSARTKWSGQLRLLRPLLATLSANG